MKHTIGVLKHCEQSPPNYLATDLGGRRNYRPETGTDTTRSHSPGFQNHALNCSYVMGLSQLSLNNIVTSAARNISKTTKINFKKYFTLSMWNSRIKALKMFSPFTYLLLG